jgi:hypothetical protein
MLIPDSGMQIATGETKRDTSLDFKKNMTLRETEEDNEKGL